MSIDKSCNLKGQQKIFYFQNSLVSSCCKSHPVKLENNKTLDYYIDLWQQEKQQLQQGIEIVPCEHCWISERRGITSFRQTYQKGHDIELYFDNLCNHMCSYCSPKLSSVWEESVRTHGIFNNISKTSITNQSMLEHESVATDHWLNQIQNYINQQPDSSINVKICGGEPLMQVKNLQKFLELDNKKINKLSINTNLNPPSNRFLIWMLENFPKNKLHFHVSLDATMNFNSVSRAGFDQDRFMANLYLLKTHNIKFSFAAVVSVLTIFDVDNFNHWIVTNQYQILYNQLYNPDCLNPVYLPEEFKQKIIDTSKNLPDLARQILSSPPASLGMVDLKLYEQYNYLNQYFSRTGIDPNNTNNQLFTEYWNWLSNKKFY